MARSIPCWTLRFSARTRTPHRVKCARNVLALALCLIFATELRAQDVIEYLSGAKTKGKVVEIKKKERRVVFESKIADRLIKRTVPYSRIRAVTYKGKRYVLNKEKAKSGSGTKVLRTIQEVNQLIDQQGRTPPDWYGTTPLEYPKTLDLTWPMPPPKPWNNQKNMGQYIWDKINPNQNKWRSGVKLMHHLLSIHKDDTQISRRVMNSLGSMYFRFFQDYPRAAFWWRQAKASSNKADGISLAECYYRMGNTRMALNAIDRRFLRVDTIKLLGNMGRTKEALQMADAYIKRIKEPQWALLAAGDACRSAGQYEKAITYYQRVSAGKMKNENYDQRARSRARQSIDAIRQFELLDISKIADGQYEAETLAYEGALAVKVTVQGGKIENVEITKHKEKQYYSALRDIPQQIIAKQSVKNIDATSRATITAEAIVAATAKALVGDAAANDTNHGSNR